VNGNATWFPALLVPLMALLLYRRFKRSVGRQPLAPRRMTARIVVLLLVGALLLATSPTATGLVGACAGALAGVALAMIALAHTKLEAGPDGNFYTPNRWLGLLVTALLVGRVAFRMATVYQASASGAPPPSMQRSPLTLAVFFVMAGYYGFYYAGVLRKMKALAPAPADHPPASR
jgi:hypothetical protein